MKNLRFLKFQEVDPLAAKISHPTSKAIAKCRNHSSIIAIRNANKGVVLVYDTQSNDSRSKDSRFMHKFCLFFTYKQTGGETDHIASKN